MTAARGATHRIQSALAEANEVSLQHYGWLLWRAGLANRMVQLPEQWWRQQIDLEAGTLIAILPGPTTTAWLVQLQRKGPPRITPLADAPPAVQPPASHQLPREVLSVWPSLFPLPKPPHWRAVARYLHLSQQARQAIPAALLSAALSLLPPLLLLGMLNRWWPIALALLLASGSLVLSLVLHAEWQRIWHNLRERQQAALGINGMQHLLRLPLPELHRFGASSSLQLWHSLRKVGSALSSNLATGLPALALLLLSSALQIQLWPGFGLASTAIMLAWLATSAWLLGSNNTLLRKQCLQRGLSGGRCLELLDASANLRLAGAEERALEWWKEGEDRAQAVQRRLDQRRNLHSAVVAAAVTSALTLAMGQQWPLGPGPLLTTLALLGLQFTASQQISLELERLQEQLLDWEKAQQLLASPSEWRPTANDPGVLKGAISAEGLAFSYGHDQPWVLENVSFQAEPGSFLGIVGASGCGKSTLLRLLLGFEQPLRGRLCFDGQPVESLQHELLRSQIGTVLQETRLVGNTIQEVIAAGRPLSLAQAWQLAELVGLADELRSLPMGMQTLVPAGGSTLSGGQRQRLAIARALVGEPKLLLFDEPTSALDNGSQMQVLNSLERLALTRVVVAHRLSTVRNADQILVLARGRVAQCGRFEDLRGQPGPFADLMRHQEW